MAVQVKIWTCKFEYAGSLQRCKLRRMASSTALLRAQYSIVTKRVDVGILQDSFQCDLLQRFKMLG